MTTELWDTIAAAFATEMMATQRTAAAPFLQPDPRLCELVLAEDKCRSGHRQLVRSGKPNAGDWHWARGFIGNPCYRFPPRLGMFGS
jgi:hypothetical protein